MRETNISKIDLNLLVALDALLRERHVTRAAQRIGMTQPAMSRALGRLRRTLDDALLVRTSTGFELTARAVSLIAPLREALSAVERVVLPAERFSPQTSTRSFSIATADLAEYLLLPSVVEQFTRLAPLASVWATPFADSETTLLERGELDIAIAPRRPEFVRAGILERKLFDERFVCVVRRDHPRVKQRLSVEQYASLSHAFIAPGGTRGGIVDEKLRELGFERRVAVALPHFLVAPHLIARSDMVLTLSERLALKMAEILPLRILEAPIDLPTFTMTMFWHERYDADAAHAWFRSIVLESSRKLGTVTRQKRVRDT